MKDDWPWLGRYKLENRMVAASGVPVTIVFIGDSITEGWATIRPDFFTSGRIGRGIGGQTTPQMVLRMISDVVSNKPTLLHILGGTNDVAENTGPITPEQSIANISMMISIARQSRIKVLLGAIPPAADFWWRPGLEPAEKIQMLNGKLKILAHETGCEWIDYHNALQDGVGGMKAAYSDDGIHPNAAGYEVMEGLVATIITTKLRRMRSKKRE
jgi:lysophospholipase L1-like esterase